MLWEIWDHITNFRVLFNSSVQAILYRHVYNCLRWLNTKLMAKHLKCPFSWWLGQVEYFFLWNKKYTNNLCLEKRDIGIAEGLQLMHRSCRCWDSHTVPPKFRNLLCIVQKIPSNSNSCNHMSTQSDVFYALFRTVMNQSFYLTLWMVDMSLSLPSPFYSQFTISFSFPLSNSELLMKAKVEKIKRNKTTKAKSKIKHILVSFT